MRSELYKPQHSDRENRDRWQKEGARDSRERAAGKAQEILAGPTQSAIPKDVRARIKQEIPGIRSFIME
jgi:trimethylamine:corrinoid methyltransferase-like protein